MNIFVISNDPVECAQALDDLRLNKMILETGQMLCTAYRVYFPNLANQMGITEVLYKDTHHNHPCNVWLRKDIHNYQWLLSYFIALANEKLHRTSLNHLTYIKLASILVAPTINLEKRTYAPSFSFNCSNVHGITDLFEAYKQCLRLKWQADKRAPKWTKRQMPAWA